MKKLATLLLGMLIVLAGCSTPADKTPEGNDPEGTDSGTITIYTPTAQDNLDVMIPAFEEATGIKVEVIRGSSGEIHVSLQL